MGMSVEPKGKKRGARPELNVTPLVDVVLVLLIIFMVMTPLVVKQFWLHVPKKSEATEPVRDNGDPPAVLSLSEDGTLRINREIVAREELREKLPRIFVASGDTVLIFDAGDDVPYGDAVEVMDLARAAGALTIAVSSQKLR